MGKLGKKARKFAKKNLQSVLRRKRKLKSFFKKKETSIKSKSAAKSSSGQTIAESIKGNSDLFQNAEFKSIFDDGSDEDNIGTLEADSDSDGFLQEDLECPYISGSDNEDNLGGASEKGGHSALMWQNKALALKLSKRKMKLEKLLKKDKKFAEYLDKENDLLKDSKGMEFSDEEDGESSSGEDSGGEATTLYHGRALTSYTIDVWSLMIMEQPNESALRGLFNGFRAACHYGIDSDEVPSQMILNREVFSKIITFVLHEADGIFGRLLGRSSSSSKETIMNLKNKPALGEVKQLIKSYLRNSIFLLSQVTDHLILVFILTRLRVSLAFFAVFPSLAARLVKISVRLWVTGDELLSLSSYHILRDIILEPHGDWIDTCLTKSYKGFISHCKFIEPNKLKHMEFLKNSLVGLYSLDIQKSYEKVLAYVQQLAYIMKQAIKMKRKEDLKMISSWQYIQSISTWVNFVTSNTRDHGLQSLLLLAVEVILGIAYLFHGPRYVPLRLKCVQMLNRLSSAGGVFIPVSHLMLDCFEQRGSNNAAIANKIDIDFSSLLKVPKNIMKLQVFEEMSVLHAIPLLSAHFAQWSFHVAFPELADIPLFTLKKYLEKSTAEPVKRKVKQFIEQVERNADFVRRRRDEATFSPGDHVSVETFCHTAKDAATQSFAKYYASISEASNPIT